MLTHAEEMRIYRDVPDSLLSVWNGDEYVYDNITKWWRSQSHEKEYPEIVLGWGSRGIEKQNETSLNHVTNTANVDDTLEIERGIPMYDELEVRFSVERGLNDDGVPGAVLSSKMGRKLVRYFRFTFDQNYVPDVVDSSSIHYEPDATGEERPVLATVVGEPEIVPEEISEDVEMRAEFTVELHYTSQYVESVQTGVEFDSSADMTSN